MSEVLTKQPAEKVPYAIDFVNLIPTGDSLATVTSVASYPSGSGDLTIGTAVIEGTEVRFVVEGGIEGTTYRIEAITLTTLGYTLEGDGRLFVTDRT
mgnify:FL=1